VRRLPELASYERDVIYAIVDATTVCHVGVVLDGQPLVLPTLHVRRGDHLLLHGSVSSLLLRTATSLEQISVAVTLVDGLIVARSTFNSSIAYRSAVLFGAARALEDPVEAATALDALVEGILPGRCAEVRASSEAELRRTRVVELRIDAASAKISMGPLSDDPDDVDGPAWAGVVPLEVRWGAPVPAPDGAVGRGEIPVPSSVRKLRGAR
jgi:nitroimidazol reductase NimA-like FMN-containing flavoprotein (pyridoxamine 5'-phosphate oxidase superfamily)